MWPKWSQVGHNAESQKIKRGQKRKIQLTQRKAPPPNEKNFAKFEINNIDEWTNVEENLKTNLSLFL